MTDWNSAVMTDSIYIHLDGEDDTMTIECNWCSEHDFMFLDTSAQSGSDWLGKAIQHITKYHSNKF